MVTMLLKKRMPLAALIGFLQTSLLFSAAADRTNRFFDLIGKTAKEKRSLIENFIEEDFYLINRPNAEGKTPVIEAVKKEDYSSLSFLLENGGDVNKADKKGNLPLYLALKAKRVPLDITNLLVRRGACTDSLIPSGTQTLFAFAQEKGPAGKIVSKAVKAKETANQKRFYDHFLPVVEDGLEGTSFDKGERHIITIIAEYAAPKSD